MEWFFQVKNENPPKFMKISMMNTKISKNIKFG
jgi:hypothetical protein